MTKKAEKMDDIAVLSFEAALKELEAIVRRLEEGQQDLEAAIADYERGSALKSHCDAKLAEAKLKVEQIVSKGDSAVTTKPMDVDE